MGIKTYYTCDRCEKVSDRLEDDWLDNMHLTPSRIYPSGLYCSKCVEVLARLLEAWRNRD